MSCDGGEWVQWMVGSGCRVMVGSACSVVGSGCRVMVGSGCSGWWECM